MPAPLPKRRFPIGAEMIPEGVHFRLWAPAAAYVDLALEPPSPSSDSPQDSLDSQLSQTPQLFPLTKENEAGYFSTLIPFPQAQEGSLYRFRLNQQPPLYPDPASRFQPQGPHGPSQVIHSSSFLWTDDAWKGVQLEGRVVYEMHIGTFTQQGTWSGAKRELLELADLGITIIEMMPVSEFAGQFGWGYDGVNLFAPTHLYGHPDELRDFINHAHALGIAVILDVIYNHFGPDGNYLPKFSPHYLTSRYTTEWGAAINFDGPESKPVREFFVTNATYWIEEFHFDGLRFDATQNIYDSSSLHILAEITTTVRKGVPHRQTYFVAENESQEIEHVLPIQEKGYGLDSLWNDDFHHTALVRLTGHNEAYYTDYLGSPQEFISAIKYGYLYQGQWYSWQQKKRGTSSLHLPPQAFTNFIQNHDQIANSAHGLRIHLLTDPGNYRAMTALLLLAPGTPLLFQGQEFASSSPFYYFADYNPEMAELVLKGRRDFFKQFPTIALPEVQAHLPPPADLETFLKCKLNFLDRELHPKEYALHRDLLRLRRNDPIFNFPRQGGIDGAVLSPEAFVFRYFGDTPEECRLLLINFGVDDHLTPAPEPLLAAPKGTEWTLLWSSEEIRYGGGGTPPLNTNQYWRLLGHAAMVLIPKKKSIDYA